MFWLLLLLLLLLLMLLSMLLVLLLLSMLLVLLALFTMLARFPFLAHTGWSHVGLQNRLGPAQERRENDTENKTEKNNPNINPPAPFWPPKGADQASIPAAPPLQTAPPGSLRSRKKRSLQRPAPVGKPTERFPSSGLRVVEE